jgi:hypothetical protein
MIKTLNANFTSFLQIVKFIVSKNFLNQIALAVDEFWAKTIFLHFKKFIFLLD